MPYKYKILLTGLGSIGRQHLANLHKLGCFYIDALRRKKEPFEGVKNIYTNYDDIPSDYDIIFITNPAALHYDTMLKLHNKTKHFFIEKPIFDRECFEKYFHSHSAASTPDSLYKKNQSSCFAQGINYTACPLRFSEIVQNLKRYAENNKIYAFRAVCSSYLPDWRKNIDYRTSCSAKKDLGGGAQLDLIHETDYLKWIFGSFDTVKHVFSKKSDLEITSNDIAVYLFENKNTAGSLHLDYFGRTPMRNIEVFTKKETAFFDILKTKADIHLEELKYFLNLIDTNDKNGYNQPDEALESLETALIERQG